MLAPQSAGRQEPVGARPDFPQKPLEPGRLLPYFIGVLVATRMTLREALDAFDTWSEAHKKRARALLESWNQAAVEREFAPEEAQVVITLHEYNASLELSPVG
jgi:hypothetical protein